MTLIVTVYTLKTRKLSQCRLDITEKKHISNALFSPN